MTTIIDDGFEVSDHDNGDEKGGDQKSSHKNKAGARNGNKNGRNRTKGAVGKNQKDTSTDTEADVENENEVEVKADVEAEVEVEADTETEVENETDVENEVDTDTDTDTDTESDVESENDLEVDVDVKAEVEANTESDVESENDLEVDVDVDAQAETEAEADSEIEVDVEVEQPGDTEPEGAGSNAAAAGVASVPVPFTHAEPQSAEAGRPWSSRQIADVIRRALAVLVVLGMIGYGLGVLRGSSNTARAEFVYSLDESIPDGFLREDRRLLTQLVTFKSDAVLAPVAAEFDLTIGALRSKIDVATVELSEVIRLDVSDRDAARAVAINRAVLDQYLRVVTAATPADDGQELAARRTEITEQLASADASRLALIASQSEDVTLELRQQSVQRQVDLANGRINLFQQRLDSADLGQISTAQAEAVSTSLRAARTELERLEADLVAIGSLRAELSAATRSQPALEREIARLESQLATVDKELAQRELGPLVASPIRELNEPLVVFHSRHQAGLQGMAAGLLLAVPVAAIVSYRFRKSQLWSD